VLGTDELFDYLDKYDLELDAHFDGLLSTHARKPWVRFVTNENSHLVTEQGVDLLDKLLRCVGAGLYLSFSGYALCVGLDGTATTRNLLDCSTR
jgi:hypothetical protein